MAKRTEKFDPLEVPGLLQKAQAGDIVARNELLRRFQCLIASLVNVCITGKYWSSYQKTFLRLFAKNQPLDAVAGMLRRELSSFETEELFSTGQLAVLIAIEKCEKNLASTIVYYFKDLIFKMIKDPSKKLHIELSECALHTYEITNIETALALEVFFMELEVNEQEAVTEILSGNKTEIPDTLKVKFRLYLEQQ